MLIELSPLQIIKQATEIVRRDPNISGQELGESSEDEIIERKKRRDPNISVLRMKLLKGKNVATQIYQERKPEKVLRIKLSREKILRKITTYQNSVKFVERLRIKKHHQFWQKYLSRKKPLSSR